MRSVLPAPVAQDQIWHDFNTYRGDTSGISLEAIEQLYCGLGDTSLRIQVQTLHSPLRCPCIFVASTQEGASPRVQV